MELHNQYTERTNWTSFIFGSVSGIIPWIVILLYFYGALNSAGAKPPAFVYAIIPTIFAFFNLFAINMFLQYKKVGPWKNYLFGERVYIILSLTSKTALAWMIFAGDCHLCKPIGICEKKLQIIQRCKQTHLQTIFKK